MRFWTGLVVLLLLASCGGGGSSHQADVNSSAQNPEQVQVKEPTRITVLPIEGPSLPMSNLLTGSVVTELEKLGFMARFGIASAGFYTLKGQAERNEWSISMPYVVLIKWIMADPAGAVVGKYVQGIEDKTWQWNYGSPKIIHDTGVIAAAMVSEMLGEGSGVDNYAGEIVSAGGVVTVPEAPVDAGTSTGLPVTVSPEQVPQQPPSDNESRDGVWVIPISGASGDGDWQLTREMKKAIVGVGLTLADSEETAKYYIDGKVSMFMNFSGKEEIIIIWTVRDSAMEEVGNATQHNQVEPGTFRGTWWKMANVVVSAVIKGVTDIIMKHALATMTVDEDMKNLDLKLELDEG